LLVFHWFTVKVKVKVKVKCTLVQALRLCTGRTANRWSRGLALLFHDHGTRRGWRVSVTPRSLFTPGKDPIPIVQGTGWAPGPVWTGAENLAATGIRSQDRPARSQSLYRLRYPAHTECWYGLLFMVCVCMRAYVEISLVRRRTRNGSSFFLKLISLLWCVATNLRLYSWVCLFSTSWLLLQLPTAGRGYVVEKWCSIVCISRICDCLILRNTENCFSTFNV